MAALYIESLGEIELVGNGVKADIKWLSYH